jgi:hypothetical protein
MSSSPQVISRASKLLRDARSALEAIESSIETPYGPEGLREILAAGFFVAVDDAGAPIPAWERIGAAAEKARSRARSKDRKDDRS